MRKRSLGRWIALVVVPLAIAVILSFVLLAMIAGGDSSLAVPVLALIIWVVSLTASIPHFVWLVSTHNELTAFGYSLPPAILYFVPLASIYAVYKYCEAMEQVTASRRQFLVGFLLAVLVHPLALIIYAQSGYNQLEGSPGPSQAWSSSPQTKP